VPHGAEEAHSSSAFFQPNYELFQHHQVNYNTGPNLQSPGDHDGGMQNHPYYQPYQHGPRFGGEQRGIFTIIVPSIVYLKRKY